jgi:hypothetical protein
MDNRIVINSASKYTSMWAEYAGMRIYANNYRNKGYLSFRSADWPAWIDVYKEKITTNCSNNRTVFKYLREKKKLKDFKHTITAPRGKSFTWELFLVDQVMSKFDHWIVLALSSPDAKYFEKRFYPWLKGKLKLLDSYLDSQSNKNNL